MEPEPWRVTSWRTGRGRGQTAAGQGKGRTMSGLLLMWYTTRKLTEFKGDWHCVNRAHFKANQTRLGDFNDEYGESCDRKWGDFCNPQRFNFVFPEISLPSGLLEWVVVLDLETEARTPAVKESLAAVLPTREVFHFLPVLHTRIR
jgi:hypothetical protein